MSRKKKKSIKDDYYAHPSSSRSNLPTEQTSGVMSDQDLMPRTHHPSRRPTGSPTLAWERQESPSRAHVAPPLFIREKIHPAAFVDSLRKSSEDRPRYLFSEFNGLPSRAHYEWYRHQGYWQNRLIHGTSQRVMASLLEREDLAGQVQMVYFDPPYGIGFKSNFQAKSTLVSGSEQKQGMSFDPLVIQAFRDTYKNGIHSYLDELLSNLTLIRQLLSDTGSLFLQIGDDNVHRVALVLDEVFGAENKVRLIPFATTSGGSSKILPSAASFLLWYAKDINQMKYHQIYEKQANREWIDSQTFAGGGGDFPDGTRRALTSKERMDPSLLPKNTRLWRMVNLTSQDYSRTGRSNPYTWNGIQFGPQGLQNSHWRVSFEGLDRLAEKDRLWTNLPSDRKSGTATQLSWILYKDEMPGRRINNLWAKAKAPSDKRYVVQTARSIIERCILMTTDPGDLVFDPTCGSGSTASVAEQWGRRWITCDASAVAIAVARELLATGIYPYHLLIDSEEGLEKENEIRAECRQDMFSTTSGFNEDPSKGFVVERVLKLTAKILAYDEDVEPTYLVDQTLKKRGVRRVSSPFTVESEHCDRYISARDATRETESDTDATNMDWISARGHIEFVQTIIQTVEKTGIAVSDKRIRVENVEPWGTPNGIVTHKASASFDKGEDVVVAAIVVGPEDGSVTASMIRRALHEASQTIQGFSLLICLAFSYDPETFSGIDKVGRIQVCKAVINRDCHIGELEASSRDVAFTMFGDPDIEVDYLENEMIAVRICGFDTYNPATGSVNQGDTIDIDCWMIDTNFDRQSFFARRIHFPNLKSRSKELRELKKVLGNQRDISRWKAMLTTESAPFVRPKTGEIAIKIITTTGAEMTCIRPV